MPQDDTATLIALVGVAVTSDAEPSERIESLRILAAHLAAEGRDGSAGLALGKAVELLGAAGAQLDTCAESLAIGEQAASSGHPDLARLAYETGLDAAVDPDACPLRGRVLQCLANCWSAEGDGKKALRYYREAAAAKRAVEGCRSQLITLVPLIEAEGRWGRPDACGALIAEGILVLQAEIRRRQREKDDLAAIARSLGVAAERVGKPQLARKVYEVVLEGFGDLEPSLRGVLVHDKGDTYADQGDGVLALECYEAAAEMKRQAGDLLGLLFTLRAVATFELQERSREDCERTLARAAALLLDPGLDAERGGSFLREVESDLAGLAREVGRQDLIAAFAAGGASGVELSPPDERVEL